MVQCLCNIILFFDALIFRIPRSEWSELLFSLIAGLTKRRLHDLLELRSVLICSLHVAIRRIHLQNRYS